MFKARSIVNNYLKNHMYFLKVIFVKISVLNVSTLVYYYILILAIVTNSYEYLRKHQKEKYSLSKILEMMQPFIITFIFFVLITNQNEFQWTL